MPLQTLDDIILSPSAASAAAVSPTDAALATSPLVATSLATSLTAALPSITVMRVDTGGSECEVSRCCVRTLVFLVATHPTYYLYLSSS